MMDVDNTVATNATTNVTLTSEPKQPQHVQQQHVQQQQQQQQQQQNSIEPVAPKQQSQPQNGSLKPPPQPSAQLKQPPPSNQQQQQQQQQQHECEPMQLKGPIHVLMTMPSSKSSSSSSSSRTSAARFGGGRIMDNGKPRSKPTKRERMQQLLLDPVLQGDYVTKRLKAYQRCMPKAGEVGKDEKPKTPSPQQPKAKSKQGKLALNNQSKCKSPTSVWDGVSQVERELVNCCESILSSSSSSSSSSYLEGYSASSDAHDDDDDDDDDEGGLQISAQDGALQIQKEVQFVGILARDCHTLSAKSLALSILERTLQLHLLENVDDDEEEDDDDEMEEEDATTDSKAAKGGTENAENEETEPLESPRSKRASTRNDESASEQPQKKQKLEDIEPEPEAGKVASMPTQDEEDEEEEEEEEEEDDGKPERLEGFLAAGGLKILNRWLVDACTEEMELPPKQPAPKPKPPATRPLILPMLRFLEHIPFDKKVVIDAKINKQIRKLGKQVTAIRKAREQNTHEPVDLQNWSLDPTVDAKDALDDVHQAIKDLKSSWEQMAKHDPSEFDDPFESLKAKMKERLDALVQYEVGEAPKPDWFDDTETGKGNAKKPPKSKTSSTKELAAKERLAERENLKQQLHAAQTEHRERLAKLREKFLKRGGDTEVASVPSTNGKKKKNGKKVVWKDGMRSQISRNREELEQVFVFEKQSPPAQDLLEITNGPVEDGPIADALMDDVEAALEGL